MSGSRKTWTTLFALACLAIPLLVGAATAEAQFRTTMLLSRAYDGGLPNGESRNGSISRDQRIGRIAAYESDATNIVPGDNNDATDVFMVKRKGPWAWNGSLWNAGETLLISRGLDGEPANGRSFKPAVSGAGSTSPTCVAFLSDASNLVADDTNGVTDAFIYNIKSKKITRVSVNSRGQQANAATTEVAVNSRCDRLAFVSRATNLAYTGGGRSQWSTAKTSQSSGQSQVYVRTLADRYKGEKFKGLTFLASASNSRRAGNGDSNEVSFARFGYSLAFTSTSTNLVGADRNANKDVYRRSFDKGRKLKFKTLLVSQRNGRVGNAASSHPSINEYGQFVAFQTEASNLLDGDHNGVSDIVERDVNKRKNFWVSKSVSGIGNGASVEPEISGGGIFVMFSSMATNLKPGTSIRPVNNGVKNIMLWNKGNRHVSVEARDHERKYLDADASNPSSSLRGNYVLFQSATTKADPVVRNFSGTQQVYLLYLGAM